MDEKALGYKLQLARKRAGLTQQELCQKANLSYSTLAKIERGAIRSPSVFTVSAIAAATGTPLEEILGNAQAPGAAQPVEKKRSKNGVTFVYFDVNGTLVHFFERAFTQISEETHIPLEIIETMFWHYDGAACRGTMTNEEVEQIFATELGLDSFSWQKYYMDSGEAGPGAQELVKWAADNYKVGLLTNNWLGYTDELLKRNKLPQVDYTAVVESAKVSCAKPEAKIYEIAQQMAGAPANEILLVDDMPAYLAGATQAGWQTIHFDENNPQESIDRVKAILEF